MMSTNLQETIFEVERLKSIVGVGNSSAYQIFATPGKDLGQMGAIVDPADMNSSNEGRIENAPAEAEQTDRPASLFKRMFSAMRKSS